MKFCFNELKLSKYLPLLLTYFILGCNSADKIPPPKYVAEPTFLATTNELFPLTGQLSFETDQLTRMKVVINDGTQSTTNEWTKETSEYTHTHQVDLFHFKPGRTHSITITALDVFNRPVVSTPLSWTAPELPALFPEITVKLSNPTLMEPGFTLFNLSQRRAAGYDGAVLEGGYIVIVDSAGDVIWYGHINDGNTGDVRQLANGHLLVLSDRTVIELDMLGNRITSWSSKAEDDIASDAVTVDTDAFHHESITLPNGNLAVLSVNRRTVDNFPVDEFNLDIRETVEVASDEIVEFSPDGNIVKRFSLLDIVDPNRVAFGSNSGFHNRVYPGLSTKDWSHANAMIYDSASDAFILSLRHQDAVVKVSRVDGRLIWILGNHEGWSANPINPNPAYPSGMLNPNNLIAPPLLSVVENQTLGNDFNWQFHQHAPEVTSLDTLMVYDNGNNRASPYDAGNIVSSVNNYSRAVEYKVNETDMTIEQVWEYRESPAIYTAFVGDADMLETTNNVLITFGGITLNSETGEPTDTPPQSKVYARLIEVTHQTPAVKVFEIQLGSSNVDDKQGWRVYRSERIKDF